MTIRKATIKDAQSIHRLINFFAGKNLMMPRSLNEIYENIRDFWVAFDKNGVLAGCAALHIVGWEGLAEIKSLAVEKKFQKKTVGSALVNTCLTEASYLKISNVFVLTYQPVFFRKLGFKTISKNKLPHKIWVECCNCPKFPNCTETALIKKVEK
ncbi:MAG: N-acetyltransferase [Candidatus Omnitrophota bacterium]